VSISAILRGAKALEHCPAFEGYLTVATKRRLFAFP
jgi:hypothetical protein